MGKYSEYLKLNQEYIASKREEASKLLDELINADNMDNKTKLELLNDYKNATNCNTYLSEDVKYLIREAYIQGWQDGAYEVLNNSVNGDDHND